MERFFGVIMAIFLLLYLYQHKNMITGRAITNAQRQGFLTTESPAGKKEATGVIRGGLKGRRWGKMAWKWPAHSSPWGDICCEFALSHIRSETLLESCHTLRMYQCKTCILMRLVFFGPLDILQQCSRLTETCICHSLDSYAGDEVLRPPHVGEHSWHWLCAPRGLLCVTIRERGRSIN